MRKLLTSEKKQQQMDAQGVGASSTDPLLGPGPGSNPPKEKETKKEKKKKFAKVLAEAKNLNVNISGGNKSEKLTVAMEREEVSIVTRSERASAEKESVLQASDIDSLEQIEALIKNKTVPAETVTIHSPESGTTIY